MSVITIYRLAEQSRNLIEGGNPGAASSISLSELKIACGQVISKLLKIDYLSVNYKMGEMIPNGGILGQYDNIVVTPYGTGKSRALLPIKPMKLMRNMGVFSLWLDGYEDNEFIPLQIGQSSLIKSQPLINNLLGQVGYEVSGLQITLTKDLSLLYPNKTLSARLVIMDIDQYGDYDTLPLPPEMEWDVVTEVYKMYSTQPLPDKVVDDTVKENKNIPLTQQKQSP